MTPFFEIRIAGDAGTPQAFQQALHQALRRLPGRARLQKVELRYSTRAARPVDEAAVRRALNSLTRQGGRQQPFAVSVRSHLDNTHGNASVLLDATGEHLLRGIGELQPPWWHRLARALGGRRQAQAASAATPPARHDPVLSPGVSVAEAVQKLHDAVVQAAALYRPARRAWQRAASPAPVAWAEVLVREPALHRALNGKVQADAGGLAAMLAKAGLTVAPGFRVVYDYQPAAEGDGTIVAGQGDLELRCHAADEPACIDSPTLDDMPPGSALPLPALRAPGGSAPSGDGMTALPAALPRVADAAAALRAARGVRVRLLGSLEQPFATPFVLNLPRLPARVDRSALEQAGFGTLHGPLLAVASNRSPLVIECDADGRIHVRFSSRDHQGQTLAMYRHGDTLEPLSGELALDELPGSIVLNDPAGVADPRTGRTLPALRLQVVAA